MHRPRTLTSVRPSRRPVACQLLAAVAGLAAIAPLAPPAGAQAAPVRHHLAELDLLHAATRRAAESLGLALDCGARVRGGLAEVVVTERDVDQLRRLGAAYTVRQLDLAEFYAQRLRQGGGGKSGGSRGSGIDWDGGAMGGYFTLAEMETLLDQITAINPAIATAKYSLGQSVEGREIWAVKVSDNVAVDEAEPEARLDSLHHAREPVSLHMAVYFLDWLVSGYGSDPLATHLVDEREIWIVPCVNPDGYEWNRSTNPGGGGLWRKNRRDNGNGTFGVDLNRNYSYQWGYDNSGSSGNTGSETYRGPSAASEPETQAMEAFISSREFRTAISAHTYSDLWLFPWGYHCADPPNRHEFDGIASGYVKENGYREGTICQELYSANGDSIDYDLGVHGIWSGTCEIGGSGDGFWPPVDRIVPLLEENLAGWARIALYAGAGIESDDWAWQPALTDGDEWLEPGEEYELAVTLENVGTLATIGGATLSVQSSHADLQVIAGFHDFGTVAAFGQADNLAAPLLLRVGAAAQAGTAVTVTADLAYDGYVETRQFAFVLGEAVVFDQDDVEGSLGWRTGLSGDTAATGRFEIADPQLTTSGGQTAQPADDHSAVGTLCAVTDGRAGSGAGSYDVDSGHTAVESPEFDLSDALEPRVSYWRWVTDLTTGDDDFVVELTGDGGATWHEVERVRGNDNQWRRVEFDPAQFVAPSDRMRLRFTADDDPNNSLCEALVDDLEFRAFRSGRLSLWRYGTALQGGQVRLHVQGVANLPFTLYVAQAGAAIPLKKLGLLELDPASLLALLSGSSGSSGRFTVHGDIPVDPTLSGVEIHVQALALDPAGAYLTNALDLLIQ